MFVEKDSIKFKYRTGGEIDSIDMTFSNHISNFSGNSLNTQNNLVSNSFLQKRNGLQNFREPFEYQEMKNSGSPHLGFAYTFGSQGNQFLHFDYQYVISKNRLLNINYLRNSSNGFLRNSKYFDNTIDIQLRKNGKKYSSLFQGYFTNKSIGLNGGVTDFTYIDLQGLDYIPVANTSAKSVIKIAEMKYQNYFNLLDDSLSGFGLTTKHTFAITNREFSETNKILNSNYDSTQTNDQYRLASIANGAGVYFKTKKLMLDALIQHKYWDFQNLGDHKDTNEVNITSSIIYKSGNYNFKNELNSNLLGAGGEWMNKANFNFKKNRFHISVSMQTEQKWPDVFQRFYFSNSTSYTLKKYNLQTRIYSIFQAKYEFSKRNFIAIEYSNSKLNNNYFFINGTWRNDTLTSILINSFKVNGSVTIGKFTLQPSITMNSTSSNYNFLPQLVLNSRLFYKKKMFKAKKLEGIYGVDFSYVSKYRLLNYNYRIDVFTTENQLINFHTMTNLSAFFGFSLGEFRFYTRIENIGYFWNNSDNQIVVGYPIQKNFIRLGITWDFFN